MILARILVAAAVSAAVCRAAALPSPGVAAALEAAPIAAEMWASAEASPVGTGDGAARAARSADRLGGEVVTSPCELEAYKSARPAALLLGEQAEIELGLVAFCPSEPVPLDVVIALDRSGSMMGWPLDDAKAAASRFVELVDLSRSRVAIVSFSTQGRIEARLSQNERHIQAAIAGLTADGGTNVSAGLREAGRALFQVPAPADVARAVVLLTDGRDGVGREAVREQARLQRERGTHLVTIGLGLQADTQLLREIASTPGDYHWAPHSRDLVLIYVSLAQRLDDIRATRVTIVDELPADMALVEGSAEPSPERDGSVLTWHLPYLPAGGVRVTYRVEPRQTGWRPTNVRAAASYIDSLDRPGSGAFPVPSILILSAPRAGTPGAPSSPTPNGGTPGGATPTSALPTGSGTPPVSPTAAPGGGATELPGPTEAPTEPTGDAPIGTAAPGGPRGASYLPIALRSSCRPDDRPIDLVLVVDASTTMLDPTDDGRRKLDVATRASLEFAARLDPARVRMAVVAFNREAYVLQGLTRDRSALAVAIAGISAAEGSRIDLGLDRARYVLAAAGGRESSGRIAVLLSDGRPVGASRGDVLGAANRLHDSGAQLYAVAVGRGADAALLRSIVEADHRYVDAVDGSQLERAFASILGTLDCP